MRLAFITTWRLFREYGSGHCTIAVVILVIACCMFQEAGPLLFFALRGPGMRK